MARLKSPRSGPASAASRTSARRCARSASSGCTTSSCKEDRPEIRGMVRTVTHLVRRGGRLKPVRQELLKVHHLRPAPGAHKRKTRVGRGEGSKGKTAGRGTKGTKARYQVPARFEGGQMPLHMRLPKLKGFTNRFRTEYQVVNLDKLAELFPEGGAIGVDDLVAAGAVRKDSWSRSSATASIAVAVAADRARVQRHAPGTRSPPPAAPPPSCSSPTRRLEVARDPGPSSRSVSGRRCAPVRNFDRPRRWASRPPAASARAHLPEPVRVSTGTVRVHTSSSGPMTRRSALSSDRRSAAPPLDRPAPTHRLRSVCPTSRWSRTAAREPRRRTRAHRLRPGVPHAGPAQEAAVHGRHHRAVPARHLAARARRRATRTSTPASTQVGQHRRLRRWSTCSAAARCCSCRCSRSASCRTSPAASSSSCWSW